MSYFYPIFDAGLTGLGEFIGGEPWHTDRWFTSPWNFLPEIREGLSLPATVQVHDVTLRDGEQQAGVVFTKDDKLRIAEALAEAGVHRIEAGLPAVSPADDAAVREMVKMGLPSKIYAFSRCLVDDVKRAADCGVDGVVMEIPSSHHLVEKAYRWPVERAIDASIEATSLAHELGAEGLVLPHRRDPGGPGRVPRSAGEGRDRRPRRRDRARRHVRRAVAARRPHVRPPDARTSRRAAGDPLPHGLRPGCGQHVDRRGRGRRGGADDRHRDRRARGQHTDGGDRARAPHDVWAGHRHPDGAVLRHLEARDGARRRLSAVEPPCRRGAPATTWSRGSSAPGCATWATSSRSRFPYRPELVGQPAAGARARQGLGTRLDRRRARPRRAERRRPSRCSRSSTRSRRAPSPPRR